MKQVTAGQCCEEIEQTSLEGDQKRPSEEVVNPYADPKEERELARPIGCRWGGGKEKTVGRNPGARKNSVCLRH